MTALQKTFTNSDKLAEPTDSEISTFLGGTPIVSFRPDDLPNFKKSPKDYSPKDRALRAAALSDFLKRKYGFPILEPASPLADEIANTDFACAIHLTQPISPTQAYSIYILRRPPQCLTATEEMAIRLNMDEHLIKNPIPSDVLRYIIVQHEIRHFQQLINGQHFGADLSGAFNKEADADAFAIRKLEEASPQSPHTESFIHLRAISGIFYAYPEYWLAPHLAHTFLQKAEGPAPDALDIRNSYCDIFLRLAILAQNRIDLEKGRNGKIYSPDQVERANQFIHEIPSYVFHEALTHYENAEPDRINTISYPKKVVLTAVRYICENLEVITATPDFHELRRNGGVIELAKQIHDKGNIDNFTRQNLKQILQAANHFCPTLSASIGCQIS